MWVRVKKRYVCFMIRGAERLRMKSAINTSSRLKAGRIGVLFFSFQEFFDEKNGIFDINAVVVVKVVGFFVIAVSEGFFKLD